MKKIISCCFVFAALLTSCVSDTEHQEVDEKSELLAENEKLKAELDEMKFGAPNLLADGKKFFESKEFSMAREKFQTLLEKHPDLPQSIDAKKYLEKIDEEELWESAASSEDISKIEDYISKYPKGKYVTSANSKKKELKKLNMEKAYEEASIENSSYTWKEFLKDYPEHPKKSSIKEKIIRLEVDEILGDESTGSMPSFNSYSTNYSSSSTVEITNNSGCPLTVRYSGVEAKMVEIPAGSTRTVNLSSGSYKIAASACGANYAGTENLHGNYGSTFYISRSRY